MIRVGSKTSMWPSPSGSSTSSVRSSLPAAISSRSSGQTAVGSSSGSSSAASWIRNSKPTVPAAQAVGEVAVQVVAAALARLVVGDPLLGQVGDEAPARPGAAAVSGDQRERVRVEVGGRGEAGERLAHLDRLGGGHRLGMGGDVGAELLEVGLAGLGIRDAGAHQLEEVLGRAGDEGGRGGREDVGLEPVPDPQLDRDPASVAVGVVRLGIAARVREPDQGVDRVALQVLSPGQSGGLRGRGEGPARPGALRVQRPVPGWGPP